MVYELAITGGTVVSYFIFYSGYDKAKKRFEVSRNLSRIFKFDNTTYSLREINKVLALSGLTLGGISIGAIFGCSSQLISFNCILKQSVGILAVHGMYSSYSFYQCNPNALLFKNTKWMSILCGITAISLFLAGETTSYTGLSLSDTGKDVVRTGAIALGTLHFYLMEIKPGPYRGKLAVRPFGYLAVVGGLAGILAGGYALLK